MAYVIDSPTQTQNQFYEIKKKRKKSFEMLHRKQQPHVQPVNNIFKTYYKKGIIVKMGKLKL